MALRICDSRPRGGAEGIFGGDVPLGHCFLKSKSYWCSHSLRQVFGPCRSQPKKTARSEKASERATFLDALPYYLVNWSLEKLVLASRTNNMIIYLVYYVAVTTLNQTQCNSCPSVINRFTA